MNISIKAAEPTDIGSAILENIKDWPEDTRKEVKLLAEQYTITGFSFSPTFNEELQIKANPMIIEYKDTEGNEFHWKIE